MKNCHLQIILFVFLIFNCSIAVSQKFDLQYKFKKGKNYKNSVVLDNTVLQSFGGEESKYLVNLKLERDLNVENVSKEKETTFLSSLVSAVLKTNTTMVDSAMTFDKSENQRQIVVNFKGKTLSSKDIKPINDQIFSTVLNQLEPMTGFTLLPGKEVSMGEKWSESLSDTTENRGIKSVQQTEITYTAIAVEKYNNIKCLKVNFESEIKTSGSGNQMGMDLNMDGKGKSTGFYYFDPKKSIVIYTETKMELEIEMNISGPQNMTINMTQSINIKSDLSLQ